jgi:hypothetical protein
MIEHGVNEYAISETQKYGHVTYFWNGNKSSKFSEELETYVEIPSDVVPFDERPWMKSAEITDELLKALASKKYQFLRVNFPNGDMVGHTGNLDATICSMEALDLALARLKKACKELGYIMLVMADHGNADEMLEKNKKGEIQVRTATPSTQSHSSSSMMTTSTKSPMANSALPTSPQLLRRSSVSKLQPAGRNPSSNKHPTTNNPTQPSWVFFFDWTPRWGRMVRRKKSSTVSTGKPALPTTLKR